MLQGSSHPKIESKQTVLYCLHVRIHIFSEEGWVGVKGPRDTLNCQRFFLPQSVSKRIKLHVTLLCELSLRFSKGGGWVGGGRLLSPSLLDLGMVSLLTTDQRLDARMRLVYWYICLNKKDNSFIDSGQII